MTLTSLKSEGGGVTKLLVGGFVPSRNDVAFAEVTMNEFKNGVTLSGKSSSDACDSLSMYECVMAACCTHCAVEYASGNSVSACTSAANADACNGVVSPPGSCLDVCNAYDDDRDACMADERCGYCDKTKRCLTGKPGTSCEPCEETYVGTDFAQGWPHEGRGVFWAPPPPPPSSPPTSPPPPAAPVCINPVSTCPVSADLTRICAGEVAKESFKSCSSIREVSIGDSVTTISPVSSPREHSAVPRHARTRPPLATHALTRLPFGLPHAHARAATRRVPSIVARASRA